MDLFGPEPQGELVIILIVTVLKHLSNESSANLAAIGLVFQMDGSLTCGIFPQQNL